MVVEIKIRMLRNIDVGQIESYMNKTIGVIICKKDNVFIPKKHIKKGGKL